MKEMYNAYTTASQMVRKTRQVVMLYEGVIRFVKQAKHAIEKNDIETRYNSLSKACNIITGLQLSLDFDKGGEIAKLLYDYYSGLDMRLMSIHQNQSTELCDLAIKHLKMMCEAWEEIDQKFGDTQEKKVEKEEDIYDQKLSEALKEARNSIYMTA